MKLDQYSLVSLHELIGKVEDFKISVSLPHDVM